MGPFYTTHVGSLPFTDVNEALDFTFSFDIPALFSLPKLNSNEFIGADLLSGLGVSYEKKDHLLHTDKSFLAGKQTLELAHEKSFFDRLEKAKKQIFKTQLVGPYTLYRLLACEDLSFNELCTFLESVYVQKIEQWLTRGDGLFVALDEPYLAQITQDELIIFKGFVKKVLKLLMTKRLNLYVHCCAHLSVEQVEQIKDIELNLDLGLYSRDEIMKLSNLRYLGGDKISEKLYLPVISGTQSILLLPSCGLAFKSILQCYQIIEALTFEKNSLVNSARHP